MHSQTPYKWLRDYCEKINIPFRGLHTLRHTSATLLLYGGVNIKQVQGRLGHSDIKVTNQYLHCIAEADEAAANVLQDMLITKKENSEQAEPINKIQKIG